MDGVDDAQLAEAKSLLRAKAMEMLALNRDIGASPHSGEPTPSQVWAQGNARSDNSHTGLTF